MRRHLHGLLVVLALTAATGGGALAAPAPRHTGLGIKLLDAPAALVKDPRARSYIIDHVGPGASISRHVQVTNDTGSPLRAALYVDAAQVQAGSFSPLQGRASNELTSWMTLTPSVMDLRQGQQAVATVTIRVPKDATRGERYATIFAEMTGGAAPGGVSITSRVGIRTYLDVGYGAAPASDFAIQSITAARSADGRPWVESAVRNIGGRALDMVGLLWLRNGPGGLAAGPFPVTLGTTLGVGQTESVSVLLDKALPAGPWLAHLQLQSDLIKHAAEATITFPAAAGASARPVEAKAVPLTKNRHLLVPLAVGLILALIVALVLFLAWRRRRRRDEDEEESAPGGHPTVPKPRRSAPVSDQADR